VQLQILRYCSLVACPYYIIDALYEKVRHGGLLINYAVLMALSEVMSHWSDFFSLLVRRGRCGNLLIVSDALAVMAIAHHAVLPSAPWQR
jgi:putative transposase